MSALVGSLPCSSLNVFSHDLTAALTRASCGSFVLPLLIAMTRRNVDAKVNKQSRHVQDASVPGQGATVGHVAVFPRNPWVETRDAEGDELR